METQDYKSIQEEFEELSTKLSDPEYLSRPEVYQKIAKRYGELKGQIAAKKDALETIESDKAAIIEVRGGAGGDEASLFAQELFRMYSRFAERKNWKVKVLSSHRTELGGLKEITFEIAGKDALKNLSNESGVHRVQRIPETEKDGRIHTSTVSVAVLPKAKPVDVEIRPEDIRVDTYRASGPGGQYVNKTSSAVRITHIPSGIVATSQEERLQQANREMAMTILRSKVLQMRLEAQSKKLGEIRRQQIGTSERSEKIRTYNFPQDRVTDHRIKKSWSNIEGIMDGNIDDVVQSLQQSV